MTRQEALTFTNRDGCRLFGVLHTPEGRRRPNLTAVLLSPGVKGRGGPHRLYLSLAAALTELGISVFRFDPEGVGDSEGIVSGDSFREVYSHIESGRYVADTVDAMDWLQRTYGGDRFLLSGLCAGALTGLLAARHDERVAGLLAVNITSVLSDRPSHSARYMTIAELEASQDLYVSRVANPKSWLRLLTLQSDYLLIRRLLAHRVRRALTSSPPVRALPSAGDNANPLFPPAFFAMLARRRPMLLVFGGSDRVRWDYEERFVCRYRAELAALPKTVHMHMIESANHVLSLAEWQDELITVTRRWVQQQFPATIADAA